MRRGDSFPTRTVYDGYLQSSEWIEYEFRRRSLRQTIEIRFPARRPPKRFTYRRESDGRTHMGELNTLVIASLPSRGAAGCQT
jgi:hypothetical protein